MEEQGKGKNKLEWTLEKVFGFENKMSIGVLGIFLVYPGPLISPDPTVLEALFMGS